MDADGHTPSCMRIDAQTGREITDTIGSHSPGEVAVTVHNRRVVRIEKKNELRCQPS